MRIYEKELYNMKKILIVLNHWSSSYIDIGVLLFRLGVGGMFMWHGFPKISGGVETWSALGKSMEVFGITLAPAFWGFMSGFAEFVGGFLLVIGFLYRPACLLLVSNMLVAFTTQMLSGAGLMKASQSFEDGFSFCAAFFIGPGKYSLDELLGVNSSRKIRFSKYE
jgi:putative oxidoreductase